MSSPFECSICLEHYDAADNAPTSFPCGHSCCLKHTAAMTTCHVCRRELPNELTVSISLRDGAMEMDETVLQQMKTMSATPDSNATAADPSTRSNKRKHKAKHAAAPVDARTLAMREFVKQGILPPEAAAPRLGTMETMFRCHRQLPVNIPYGANFGKLAAVLGGWYLLGEIVDEDRMFTNSNPADGTVVTLEVRDIEGQHIQLAMLCYDANDPEIVATLSSMKPQHTIFASFAFWTSNQTAATSILEVQVIALPLADVLPIVKQCLHNSDKCWNCSAAGSSRCQRCVIAKYCSRACRVAHWPVHKKLCKGKHSIAHHVHTAHHCSLQLELQSKDW